MADIQSARDTAETSALAARDATRAFEEAVGDWQRALRDAIPITIETQARRHVEAEPEVSLALGRDRVQELKGQTRQLADELKQSIPATITPEAVRAAQPVPGVLQDSAPEEVAKAARRDAVSKLERPLGQLIESFGFSWNGLITDRPWAESVAALKDEDEVKTARRVAATLASERVAAREAAYAADALKRTESASLWDD